MHVYIGIHRYERGYDMEDEYSVCVYLALSISLSLSLTCKHRSKSLHSTHSTLRPEMSSWQYVQLYLAYRSIMKSKRMKSRDISYREGAKEQKK